MILLSTLFQDHHYITGKFEVNYLSLCFTLHQSQQGAAEFGLLLILLSFTFSPLFPHQGFLSEKFKEKEETGSQGQRRR